MQPPQWRASLNLGALLLLLEASSLSSGYSLHAASDKQWNVWKLQSSDAASMLVCYTTAWVGSVSQAANTSSLAVAAGTFSALGKSRLSQ